MSTVNVPDLTAELNRLIRQIPRGQVATYGGVAEALGDVVASRWVGQYARRHAHTEDCPCHRLVLADGKLGGYVTGRTSDKRQRLQDEGIAVVGNRVALPQSLFSRFISESPLTGLREQQSALAARVALQPLPETLTWVGGIDISYSNGMAFATLVCLKSDAGAVAWHTTLAETVRFPYISGYLAFRELPIAVALLKQVVQLRDLPQVILVDGSGVLHPRGCGIATMLGVLTSIPTIGLTKKLLCGRVDPETLEQEGAASIVLEGQCLGTAVRSRGRSRRPVYVSPGYGTDVHSALACVRAFWGDRRLPAPIYWADRLSRQRARSHAEASAGSLWTGEAESI